jgi:hypothetical protein
VIINLSYGADMKMSDVKVGMRLVSTFFGGLTPVTVTEITEKGFKYKLDHIIPFNSTSHFGIDGHEHYGLNGEALYSLEKETSNVKSS